MADSKKITILLADEGRAAPRRPRRSPRRHRQSSKLSLAVRWTGKLRLTRSGSCAIPAVAVVDLNIPKVHGIELVRRIRSESLGTKVVILSGSTDDDIIREVVRAGGDAYLLKNGPARHLTDAISYVCDGGQYFSPQLRRDGLDRRLLEEVPRSAPQARPAHVEDEPLEEEDDRPARAAENRGPRDSRYTRSRRPAPTRRTADPRRDSGSGSRRTATKISKTGTMKSSA